MTVVQQAGLKLAVLAYRHSLGFGSTRSLLSGVAYGPASLFSAGSSIVQQQGLSSSVVCQHHFSNVSFGRGLSFRAWELSALPTVRGQFQETRVVKGLGLLPNRQELALQFSPHGVAMVPKGIVDPIPGLVPDVSRASKSTASTASEQPSLVKRAPFAAPAAAQSGSTASEDGQQDDQQLGYFMKDRTKMWRRLKMKKHKIRKRRKANRYKVTSA